MDNPERTPPKKAWLVWGVATMLPLFQVMMQVSPSVMIPDLKTALHTDSFGISFFTSVLYYSYIPLQLPIGYFVDRFKPKRIIIFSFLLYAATLLALPFCQTLFSGSVMRFLMGIGSAPSVVATLYVAAAWFPANRFAILTGLTEMVALLGGYLGQAGLSRCVVHFGWRATFWGCSATGLYLATLAFFLLKDYGPYSISSSQSEVMPNRPRLSHTLLGVLKNKQLWIVGTASGLCFAVISVFGSLWSIPFLERFYGLSRVGAANASALVFLGTAMGCLVVGWFSDFIGKRKAPLLWGIVLTLAFMGSIIYITPSSYTLLCMLLFSLGFFSASYIIPFATARELTMRHQHSVALGFINMQCLIVGAPLLLPVVGFLINHAGAGIDNSPTNLSFMIALSVIPIALIFAILFSYFSAETYCRPLQSRIDMDTDEKVIEYKEPEEEMVAEE